MQLKILDISMDSKSVCVCVKIGMRHRNNNGRIDVNDL